MVCSQLHLFISDNTWRGRGWRCRGPRSVWWCRAWRWSRPGTSPRCRGRTNQRWGLRSRDQLSTNHSSPVVEDHPVLPPPHVVPQPHTQLLTVKEGFMLRLNDHSCMYDVHMYLESRCYTLFNILHNLKRCPILVAMSIQNLTSIIVMTPWPTFTFQKI